MCGGRPTTPGELTKISTAKKGFIDANMTNRSALTNPTRVFASRIDLAFDLTGRTNTILDNDLVSYHLAVPNLGPQGAAASSPPTGCPPMPCSKVFHQFLSLFDWAGTNWPGSSNLWLRVPVASYSEPAIHYSKLEITVSGQVRPAVRR